MKNILHIKNGIVHVPIVTLTKAERQIVLLGMIHVASQSFFEEIMEQLLKLESRNFQILYEEVEGIPSAEKAKLKILFHKLKAYGLVSQLDTLKIKSTWKTADVFADEVVDDLEKDAKDESWIQSPEKYIHEILLPQLENPSIDVPDVVLMIKNRNEFAVKTILEYANTTDVASFWGCSHIPGMVELLEQHKFEVSCVEWVEAINIDEVRSLLKSVR